MEKRIIKSQREILIEICDCGKEIKGFSKSSLEYNLRLHKETHTNNLKGGKK